jgi:hypothetical protein
MIDEALQLLITGHWFRIYLAQSLTRQLKAIITTYTFVSLVAWACFADGVHPVVTGAIIGHACASGHVESSAARSTF